MALIKTNDVQRGGATTLFPGSTDKSHQISFLSSSLSDTVDNQIKKNTHAN